MHWSKKFIKEEGFLLTLFIMTCWFGGSLLMFLLTGSDVSDWWNYFVLEYCLGLLIFFTPFIILSAAGDGSSSKTNSRRDYCEKGYDYDDFSE